MIVSTMANDEIFKECMQDFWEMKSGIEHLGDRFRKAHNPKNKKKYGFFVPNTIERHTHVSRNKNTWHIEFMALTNVNGVRYAALTFVYMTYTNRDESTNYLFLTDLIDGGAFLLTAHFLQRYKERYIELNHIKLAGENIACYFMRHNLDTKKTNFWPKQWTEEERKENEVRISEQGLMVVKRSRNFKFLRFITFLSQEVLSEYKARIYEEEELWKNFRKIEEYIGKEDIVSKKEKHALFIKIFNTPNLEEKITNYLNRIIQKEYREFVIKKTLETLEETRRLTEEIEEGYQQDPDYNNEKENMVNIHNMIHNRAEAKRK